MVKTFALIFLTACLVSLAVHRLEATPNFLRSIGSPPEGCHACHTHSPRLNEFGYRFRAAGYRIPNTLGKLSEKPYELGDHFAGGFEFTYTGSKTTTGAVSSHISQLGSGTVHIWPFTGSFGKYYSSKAEITFGPKGVLGFNAANVRYARGSGDQFFTARLGVLQKEGYGGADRSIGLSSPLFTGAANFNQTQFFTFQSTAGLEVGYDYKRTSIFAQITNGIVILNENGTLTAFGAQGSSLAKPAGQTTSSSPDFQITANQILTNNGGGVFLQLYHGHSGIPFLGSTTKFWKNSFDRMLLYGSYPVCKYVLLLAGYGAGRDHLETGATFGSGGYFTSIEVPIITNKPTIATAGYRYDFFDPAKTKVANEVTASAAYISFITLSGLRLTGEYSHRNTLRGISPDQWTDQFLARLELFR
jgi:hypothetical protein